MATATAADSTEASESQHPQISSSTAATAAAFSRRRLALAAVAVSVGTGAIGGVVGNGGAALALVDDDNAQAVFAGASKSVVSLADYMEGGINGGYTPRGTGVIWSDRGYVAGLTQIPFFPFSAAQLEHL